MFKLFNGNKKITEKLYEQNLELAVKNKTLSLLEKLYKTSVLTLTPEEMSKKITDIICKDLNLEFAGVLILKKEADYLKPLSFSKSERLTKTLNKLGFLFGDIKITDISKRDFVRQAIYNQKDNITNNIEEVWKGLIKPEHLKEIRTESHVKTILLYPLIIGKEVIGVLLLGLNRDYDTLNTFEKESTKNFINIIALLLDKAYLYKNLQDSYEITKRAYAIEKKAKEELEKLDKYKNDFLRQTQHDLRRPLTVILGYCDLLLSGTFGKQPKKSVDIIKKMQVVTQDKARDINNFLDTEQFKIGKGVVLLKPGVELLPILEEIISVLGPGAQSKGTYLKLENPEKIFTVSADREKLKSALFNIIDNAVKYTLKGGVDIKIENHNSVKIIVSDTGIGIPQDKIKNIFETQFERMDQAKVTAIGSGVGLYLSAQIIKLHNGKIWVESKGQNQGSTFHIELPI